MNYQTFQPQADLASLVKCYWTLEIPAQENAQKQCILPDGCPEMIFILGDDIRRYISENEFILQPRALVLGQILEPFFVQPTGYVHSFAVRFYPYGFANLVSMPLNDLASKETPINELFDQKTGNDLEQNIIQASNTQERIKSIERFLLDRFKHQATIDSIVKSTVDALMSTRGSAPINTILREALSKRRQLERKFLKQVGLSPKQLGRIIRLQTALKMLLNKQAGNLTEIAYESEYFDQAHFIKDFKAFTGTSPKDFLKDDTMVLSSLLYSRD